MYAGSAAVLPVAGILDLTLTWNHVKKGFWNPDKRTGWFPDLAALIANGIKPVEECGFSVFIHPTSVERILDVREWLAEHTQKNTVQMFGRYGFRNYDFRTDREFHGLRFRFNTKEEALIFSLMFQDMT
jgi:hypothetical protein